MREPSGEICASLTRSQSSQCSVVSSVAERVSWATRPAPPIAAITNATTNRLMANLLRLEYCGMRIADCGFDCGFYCGFDCGLEAIIRNPIRNPQSEIRNCEIRITAALLSSAVQKRAPARAAMRGDLASAAAPAGTGRRLPRAGAARSADRRTARTTA